MTSYGRVAVILGGNSGERDVSLKSGQAVYEALERKGVDVIKIDSQSELLSQLEHHNIDRAFIALHGIGGEDGTIQGILEFMQTPYTGSGVMASAICMDKWRTKLIWSGLGLATPQYKLVASSVELNEFADDIGLPLMVKPSLEGSSIGISKVSNTNDIESAFKQAVDTGSAVMVEQFIEGKEFTVAIVNEVTLPVIQLQPANDFYDFDAKYNSNDTQYLIPSGLSKHEEEKLQELALDAYKALDCQGWGRVDVMQDAAGKFWLIEVNTIPGMTNHSLVPMAAKAANISFDELVINILDTAK